MWKIFVTALVLLAVALRWWQKKVITRCKLHEMESPALPFVGHAWRFIQDSQGHMNSITNLGEQAMRHGGILAIWIGHKLIVGVVDATVSEHVLKTWLDKGGPQSAARLITGNGTLFTDVHIWRNRRRLVAPLFSPKNLMLFEEVFSRQSNTLARQLRSVAGKGPSKLWSYLTKYTFDTVCNTTLGINIDAQNKPDHPFLWAFYKSFKLTSARIWSPWMWCDAIYKLSSEYAEVMEHKKFMYDFILQVIDINTKHDQRSEANPLLTDNRYKTPSITELLLQTNEAGSLTLTDQSEEILIFAAAGVDTSSIGISFALHMLARHQDVQEKVHIELKETFGNSTREVTYEDLQKLQYLDCVIKETMRLYPPVPNVSRTVKEDIVLTNGQILPKNCIVVVGISGIHRNPKYWGADADQFRPERFLEPFTHPKQYLPFSDGPRNCIGYKYALLSMTTALSVLLRKYKVLPAKTSVETKADSTNDASQSMNNVVKCNKNDSETKKDEIRVGAGIVLKDRENVFLRLELR